MSKPKGKFMMDALEELSGSDVSDSDADDKSGPEGEQPGKKAKKDITIEDLQKAGYKSGPSILRMRAPEEQQELNWNWSDGRQAKEQETEETLEERRATQVAATRGAEETAMYASKALEHAERMRHEKKVEKERLAEEKRLSFNQKEKRKRDEGKTSRAKNFVEEEKRMMRGLGVYSGFDT